MDTCLIESKKVPLEEHEISMMVAPREATKAKETKEVSLGLVDLAKTVKIGAYQDPK